MTDMNSYVLVCSTFKQGYSLLCNVNQVPSVVCTDNTTDPCYYNVV